MLTGTLNAEKYLTGYLTYIGSNAPYIGSNKHWYVYDTSEQAYVDSGIAAQGEPGTGLDILGTYATVEALAAAVTSPNQGDVYIVGAAAPYTLYMWDDGASSWLSLGGLSGEDGRGIVSVERTSGTGTAGTIDTYTITYTDETTTTFEVYNGSNGTDGYDGRGISSIVRTSGTGAAGTTDTYTITYTDATTSTFSIYNGADGTGSGDMLAFTYDPTNKAADAFDMDNMADGDTNKVFTATERAKLSGIAEGAEVNVNSDWNATDGDAYIANKPTIPTALSGLSDDSTHRLVTDTEKGTWNGKQSAITASGILKGDGSGGVSQATAGTDYYAPSGTDIPVTDGGTGASTASAARSNLGAAAETTITTNTNASPTLGTLSHNTEYRCTNASPSAAPTMTIASIASTSTQFYAAVIYKSPGTTAPTVTNNSGYTLKYTGTDVSSGTFTPVSGTVYHISFLFDGIYLNAYVVGVS